MQPQHTLFVCTSCASVWKDGKTIGKSGGQQLLEQLLQYPNWDLRDEWQIQPVECMSACSHSCAISFAAIGKYTYLFGDLPYSEENLSAIADVLNCADNYYLSPDGLLPWSERPAALKKGVVARIPPIPIKTLDSRE